MTYQRTFQKVTKLVNSDANLFTVLGSQSHVGPVAYTTLLSVDNRQKDCKRETFYFLAIQAQPFPADQGERSSEHCGYINRKENTTKRTNREGKPSGISMRMLPRDFISATRNLFTWQ